MYYLIQFYNRRQRMQKQKNITYQTKKKNKQNKKKVLF